MSCYAISDLCQSTDILQGNPLATVSERELSLVDTESLDTTPNSIVEAVKAKVTLYFVRRQPREIIPSLHQHFKRSTKS